MLEVQFFFKKFTFIKQNSTWAVRTHGEAFVWIRTHDVSPYYVIFVTCDNVTRKIGRCVEDFDNTTYGDFLLFTSILWCVTRDKENGKGCLEGRICIYIWMYSIFKYTIRFIYNYFNSVTLYSLYFWNKEWMHLCHNFLLSHVTKSCIVHFIHNSLFCCHAVTCHNTIQCYQSFCLFFQWSSVLLAIFKYNTSYWL